MRVVKNKVDNISHQELKNLYIKRYKYEFIYMIRYVCLNLYPLRVIMMLDLQAGVYILQNTMVVGGMAAGKKKFF